MKFKNDLIQMVKLSHSQRREYIKSFLISNKIAFNEYKYNAGINIEVSIQGIEQDKEIIFFSHYDIAKSSSQGANDNTSSVVVMMNIAKYLSQTSPQYNIKIIFNDSEEIIGAIFNNATNQSKRMTILDNVGSFNYLKHFPNIGNIRAVFVLELSGIGDSVYIAKKSGSVICDSALVNFLERMAMDNNVPYHILSVPSCDILSVYVKKLSGVVLGAVPTEELAPLSNNPNEGVFIPPAWQTIHTLADNHIAIREESLQMVFNFVSLLVDNIGLLP